MRKQPAVKLKEPDPKDIPKPPIHETLIEALLKINVSKIPRVHSLDTKEKPLAVYGRTYDEYTEHIERVSSVIHANHTLTKLGVFEPRRMYDGYAFFISRDGYYSDRRKSITELINTFYEFAKLIERVHGTVGKSNVQKYNLLITEAILSDMLSFVESIVNVE